MAGEVQVRAMIPEDVPWAIALTDTESWGYTAADFERLTFLEPEGVLVAESAGERIGITAIVTYDALAYIGAVIVDQSWRGKHVGESLMQAALALADDRGISSTRLNAYLHVIPFYERLGFRREFENHRYSGASEGWGTPGVRLVREDDLEDLAALDAAHFGANRQKVLSRLFEEFSRSSLVFDDGGEIVAFAFGNPGPDSCEIGPMVCPPERATEGEALLNTMLRITATPCAFSVPSLNEKATTAAKRAGLAETFRTMRMVRGSSDHGGTPQGVWALAGLEKG